ncbi:MAG: aldehyde ferredoxin oxidoreductase N-terminal domain-containing protein, partial [Myxococcota bacterium]|nr:aldehyde ferredoxin oxidoreductase N-terminal domain-containing protein [Myxococcota bacterium]
MIKGYAGRILEINLETRTHIFKRLDEETAQLYIGGKGYGVRLLYDMTEGGLDPFSSSNPLIFATGPLNGSVAPQSNRFAVVSKSPLTGGIGHATCGGSFAYALKRAGIDILIIQGKAREPLRLEIEDDEIRFLGARDLWGKGTYATQSLLGKKMSHAVIGKAGESKVLYAGIVSGERIAGRGGMGAVMGSKRLKAISVMGSRKIEMDDPKAFKEYTRHVRELFGEHPVLGESMKRFGTGAIVNTTNARNILPTRNFSRGHFDQAMNISGEHLEKNGLKGVKSSCIHCPVTCGREVELENVGRVKGPEYESLALL